MIEGLTYGDVLIVPNYSEIPTRTEIDIRTEYLGRARVPIISAPMDTVSGPEMAAALHRANAYSILHRFGDIESMVTDTLRYALNTEISISVGVKDWEETRKILENVIPFGIHSICIDVAHGDHILVQETIYNIRNWFADQGLNIPYIIAGNVATPNGFNRLAAAGADAIRVGIGPGSACTTRETTGVGYPQLSAIQEVNRWRQTNSYVSIIADGGIQNPGDIAKALAAGADAVMLGRMLAGADEAPGELASRGRKEYNGQSTKGSNGLRGAPEGVSGFVPRTGPVSGTIEQLVHYLKSSFSYVGARDIQEFRNRAEFVKVSPATHLESGVRI